MKWKAGLNTTARGRIKAGYSGPDDLAGGPGQQVNSFRKTVSRRRGPARAAKP